jgi:peptide deformylase
MEDTTVAAEGLGLAAPQVGSSHRLCIAKIGGRLVPLMNPYITWKSAETDVMEEGCLSLPGINVDVERSSTIVVTYIDMKGKSHERRLQNLEARIVQHEVDHLEGVLIVDYR